MAYSTKCKSIFWIWRLSTVELFFIPSWFFHCINSLSCRCVQFFSGLVKKSDRTFYFFLPYRTVLIILNIASGRAGYTWAIFNTNPNILFILPFRWLKQICYIFIFKTDNCSYFEITNTLGYLALLFRRCGSFFRVSSICSQNQWFNQRKRNIIEIWSQFNYFSYFIWIA